MTSAASASVIQLRTDILTQRECYIDNPSEFFLNEFVSAL